MSERATAGVGDDVLAEQVRWLNVGAVAGAALFAAVLLVLVTGAADPKLPAVPGFPSGGTDQGPVPPPSGFPSGFPTDLPSPPGGFPSGFPTDLPSLPAFPTGAP